MLKSTAFPGVRKAVFDSIIHKLTPRNLLKPGVTLGVRKALIDSIVHKLTPHYLLEPGVSPEVRNAVFDRIFRAIIEIHGKGVVHNALNPKSVLVDKNMMVRIIGFGSARNANIPLPGLLNPYELDWMCIHHMRCHS